MLILEPKKLKDRLIKRHQQNKKLLMENEILHIKYLDIDDSWNFDLDSKYIKTKKIKGNVWLRLNHIPEWISNIEIDGYFSCSGRNLITLKNCPKIINKSFYCSSNKLTTLDDGPTFVDGDYTCWKNDVKFTEEYVSSICEVKNNIFV